MNTKEAKQDLKKNQLAHKMKVKAGGSIWGMSKKDVHKWSENKYSGYQKWQEELRNKK